MKLTLVTVGTRGDITPFVALGCGLKKAGHVVTVASHRDFEKMIIELSKENFAKKRNHSRDSGTHTTRKYVLMSF